MRRIPNPLTALAGLILLGTPPVLATTVALKPQPIVQPDAVDGAQAPVETLHSALLDAMKMAKTKDVRARFAILEPVLARTFDMRLMTALSAGSFWRGVSVESQKALVDAFQRFSIATYASRFNGWSGQSFETLAVNDGPRGTKIVRTRINNPDKEPVPLSYVLREAAGHWRIVDILLAAGISEIAVRRSEYRSVLKSGGVAALAALLETRTGKLLAP